MQFDHDTQGMKCDHCGRLESVEIQWVEAPEYLYNPTADEYTAPDW